MDIVRLVEYVREWEIFDKIDFDQIVSDYSFDDVDNISNFIKINNISDLIKVDKNKKTLFILDRLLIENISEYMDMGNISIIDLNAWLFSYGNKIGISKYDIVELFKLWFNVFEPLDLFSMLNFLDKTWKNYIRICDIDLPTNFVNSNYNEIISLDDKWFIGNMTLVSTWMMFTEVVRLANLLNEQWIHVKIKILNKLNFDDMTPLSNDENIVFILDLLNHTGYENYLKDKLKWKNLNFIYPSYHKLSTMLDEYKMEELEFDVESLTNKILQK
jgi:hypothetical protein